MYSRSAKHQVVAHYSNPAGEIQKLYLFGELSVDDSLVIKEVISSHLEQHSRQSLSPVIGENGFPGKKLVCLSLELVVDGNSIS